MNILNKGKRGVVGLAVLLTIGILTFSPVQARAATCTEGNWEYGDRHYCVGLIQWLLNDEGGYFRYPGWAMLTADEQFGSKTKAQVKAFQTYAHIGVDGEVGPQTWGALCSYAVTAYYGYLNMGNWRAAAFLHADATHAGCYMPPEEN